MDSLAHDIVALHSYHPELAVEEILERALKSGLTGAGFLGFMRSVHHAAAQGSRITLLGANPKGRHAEPQSVVVAESRATESAAAPTSEKNSQSAEGTVNPLATLLGTGA